MNYEITPLERIVLESLNIKKKTKLELFKCTKISPEILNNIIMELLSKNLIIKEHDIFTLNKYLCAHSKSILKSKDNIKLEATEIVEACIESSFQDKSIFKMKKLFLTNQEERTLNTLLKQLELFIENTSNNKKTSQTKEQNLIFWGKANYGKIIDHYITY